MKTIIWVLMGVLVGISFSSTQDSGSSAPYSSRSLRYDGRLSFAQKLSDPALQADARNTQSSDLRSSDPNLKEVITPRNEVAARPFKGYGTLHVQAEEVQPEVAAELYELSKWLKEVYDRLPKD